jgi:hypothetical protein
MLEKVRWLRGLQPICLKAVNVARAKAGWASALAAVALASCRFGYEPIDLLSSGDGGGAADGGGPSSGNGSFSGAAGTASAAAGTVNGGAGSTEEGGAGGLMDGGGTTGAAGGSEGGRGGAGAEPTVCVPDASCSCETFAGHDYRFCSILTTRDAGLAACQSANLVLIRIDSAEENAWLLQQFTDHGMFMGVGTPIVLLGGNDLEGAGMWRWDDGTLFWDGAPVDDLYTNWSSPPKPSQSDCLGMTADGQWASRSCDSGNATVACESP